MSLPAGRQALKIILERSGRIILANGIKNLAMIPASAGRVFPARVFLVTSFQKEVTEKHILIRVRDSSIPVGMTNIRNTNPHLTSP